MLCETDMMKFITTDAEVKGAEAEAPEERNDEDEEGLTEKELEEKNVKEEAHKDPMDEASKAVVIKSREVAGDIAKAATMDTEECDSQ